MAVFHWKENFLREQALVLDYWREYGAVQLEPASEGGGAASPSEWIPSLTP
jgi:hypothetical protein